jgi:hypothetical protein
MRWVVEYYEQADTTQPAEDFEISLMRHHKKLGAKLRSIVAAIEVYGPSLVEVLSSHVMITRACGRYALSLTDF